MTTTAATFLITIALPPPTPKKGMGGMKRPLSTESERQTKDPYLHKCFCLTCFTLDDKHSCTFL